MSAHPADVLAESIHCGCQAPNDTCKYDDAAAMLRTIPAMEAELAKLREQAECLQWIFSLLEMDEYGYWTREMCIRGIDEGQPSYQDFIAALSRARLRRVT